jgi:hypothetical protein
MLVATPVAENLPIQNIKRRINLLRRRILETDDPKIVLKIIDETDTIEDMMERAGFATQQEEIRPANEARFLARWRLGQLLAKVEREQTAGLKRGSAPSSRAGTTGFRAFLADLGLNKNRSRDGVIQLLSTI